MEPRELAYDDWLNGMKYQDIADKYKVTLSAVKSWAARDWKRRKVATGGKKKLQPKSRKVAAKPPQLAPAASLDRQLADAVEGNGELTDKQRQFCYCYMKNFNATQAARNAGYSGNNLGQIGWQLLQLDSIRKEISELKLIKNEWLGGLCGEDIIELHMRIAFADFTDFAEFNGRTVLETYKGKAVTVENPITKEHVPVTRVVNTVKLMDSSRIDGQLITEVSEGREGVKIKLADRWKSLDFLARYFELNPMDRHRREYDRKRYELEVQKAEAAQSNETADDWIEALTESDDDAENGDEAE
ncbi:MAG: terminase small subunit [Oscillospiraceae bacterium]|jgi:phage terminase small subunit|nr:terminase small subunit [Oscillospiraceae bacterium]